MNRADNKEWLTTELNALYEDSKSGNYVRFVKQNYSIAELAMMASQLDGNKAYSEWNPSFKSTMRKFLYKKALSSAEKNHSNNPCVVSAKRIAETLKKNGFYS